MKRDIVEFCRGHRASLPSPHGIGVHHPLGTAVCSPTRKVPQLSVQSLYWGLVMLP